MEHMAWKGRIKPGCKAEYQRRHAEIWPEMVKVLKEAGICNYSIFYCKDELFGYYECLQRFPHCEAALLPAHGICRLLPLRRGYLAPCKEHPTQGATVQYLNALPHMALQQAPHRASWQLPYSYP